jgi:hypothetical protein
MTLHRLTNIALFVGILATWFLVMDSDYRADADTALQQEQRQYMHAIQVCHKAYGPAVAPEYDDSGKLICVSKRGKKYQVML